MGCSADGIRLILHLHEKLRVRLRTEREASAASKPFTGRLHRKTGTGETTLPLPGAVCQPNPQFVERVLTGERGVHRPEFLQRSAYTGIIARNIWTDGEYGGNR